MRKLASIVASLVALQAFAGEMPVEAEARVGVDSSQLKYGLPENTDPVLSLEAELTAFGWVSLGIEDVHDITPYGRGAGYGNRAGEYRELCPSASLAHRFGWLGASVGYEYERHPPRVEEDTHFVTASLCLPDVPLAPRLEYERDVCRDHGTYFRAAVSHEFEITGRVGIEVEASQGFGDRRRIHGSVGDADRAGVMDTRISATARYRITESMAVGCRAEFSDYLLDCGIADATDGEPWRFSCGAFASFGF